MKLLKEHKSFGGATQFYEHESPSTKTTMKFSTFLPCAVSEVESAIIWLSGLTCNEENFITKAGVQSCLEKTKTMIICPDTSPRGLGISGEDDSYDFGSGAGFYVNATIEPYTENYQMYDYVAKDLVGILESDFGVKSISIMGHSMGGHGALVIGLKEHAVFKSISAFSPIVNPISCAWGQKAFSGYLGMDKGSWSQYDACEIIRDSKTTGSPILIDQGLDDEFFQEQLLTKNFENICLELNCSAVIRYQEGYDHSYYFISTFLEDHIKFHLKHL
jgi:S-formylglutathione hydrolase